MAITQMTINRPHPSPLRASVCPSLPLPGSGLLGVASPPRAPTVLVVQPDRTIRTVAIAALQASGYRGVGVARGDEALFMLLERRFDAVLLGAELPGIAARELCVRLRAIESHVTTPVLYLLHPNEQVQMEGFFAAGGDDFLTLPLSPQLLKTRLAGRLHRGAAQKRRTGEDGEPLKVPASGEPSPGAAVMVVRSWMQPHASGLHVPSSGLGARGVATQLGLQVECIYRHGGKVERLSEGVVYALFDGPTGIFDAGQCSNAILAIGAGPGSNSEEPPRVALGIVGCGAGAGGGDSATGRASLLEGAFAAALEHCKTARAMQVMVSPELHGALGGLAHVRYARSSAELVEGPVNVPVRRLRRARGHAA